MFAKKLPFSYFESSSLTSHALVKGNEDAGYEGEEILVKYFRWSRARGGRTQRKDNKIRRIRLLLYLLKFEDALRDLGLCVHPHILQAAPKTRL